MSSRDERLVPIDPADTAPTALSNVLAAASDYPRYVYGMDTYYWWPRLMPLLPPEFQDLLRSMETPIRSLLNLSLVSLYLGCLTAAVLGLADSNLALAAVSLAIGVVFAELLYRGAASCGPREREHSPPCWAAASGYWRARKRRSRLASACCTRHQSWERLRFFSMVKRSSTSSIITFPRVNVYRGVRSTTDARLGAEQRRWVRSLRYTRIAPFWCFVESSGRKHAGLSREGAVRRVLLSSFGTVHHSVQLRRPHTPRKPAIPACRHVDLLRMTG
jgi:hypothetical protein